MPAMTDAAVRVQGLPELQRAFRRIGGDLPKATRKTLRAIAKPVQEKAKANVQHKTGRHGGASVPHLASSIRIGVTSRSVSVYSNAPHALVQDQGGRVGHGAVITRASASAYMTKAVQESQPEVENALGNLGDDIARTFEGG